MARIDLTPQDLDSIEDPAQNQGSERAYRRGHWAWSETRKVQSWDPVRYPSAWMTYEIQEALNAIPEPNSRKKRCTVLRMAEAKVNGLSIRSVFDMPDTCSTQTWYGRTTEDPGWKDDPAIAKALELATRRAQEWQDQEEAQRMTLRQRQLSQTQDELVDLSKLATQTLAELMMNAGSEKVRLEAAETVLDRADEATAKKLVAATDITVGERKGPRMSEIRRRQRERGERAHEDYADVDAEAALTSTVSRTALLEPVEETYSLPDFDGDDGVEWVSVEAAE